MLNRIARKMTRQVSIPAPPVKNGRRAVQSSLPVFNPCSDSLASMLAAHARKPDKARLGGSWLHVSALVNGDCLRAYRLAEIEGITPLIKPRVADRLLWAIGKAVEAHIRYSMIDLYGREDCFGEWSCKCGAKKISGMGSTDSCCLKCNSPASFYDEFNVRHEGTMLTGSPDFVIRRHGSRKLTVVEIKSIKVVPKNGVSTTAPDFHTLQGPQRNHSLQVLLYRRLLELTGHEVTKEALVLYGAKDYVMESPYKPFTLDATAEENVRAVDHLLSLATEYAKAVKSKSIMPRISLCSSCNTSRAKECPMAASCFSRK